MDKSKSGVVIVIPAYNSEKTLEKVYKNIPKGLADRIIIVDDNSKDETIKVIRKLGVKPIVHRRNLGYGANQKTLYKEALKSNAKYIIMLHPDNQYDPRDLFKFVGALKSRKGDLILGSRFMSDINQTPLYKSIFLRLITILFNMCLGIKLSEVNTGYRGYTRKLLETIPFEKNGNGYIFDPQLLLQTAFFGFKISEVPVSKRYSKEAISPNFSKSVHHGLENIKLLWEYTLQKWNMKKTDFLTYENK